MKRSARRTKRTATIGIGVELLVEQLESRLLLSASAATSSLSITPATVSIVNGTTQQFKAVALDQSGHALTVQPKFTWKVSGGGKISSTGLFTANGGGSVLVTASANGLSAQANVTVISLAAAPTNLKASLQNGQVVLSWTGSTGATSYDIYRGTSSANEGNTPFATGVTALNFTDKSVTGGTTYYYKVTAANAAGQSKRSGEASLKVPKVPAVPTGLTLTAGQGNVNLSWNAVSGAAGYDIYRGTSSGGESLDTYVTGTSYNDTAVSAGTKYYYQVSAVNTNGQGARSSEASVQMPMIPAVPTGLAVTASQGNVNLSWNAVSGAAGYDIYRGTSSGGESLDTYVTGSSYNDTAVSALTTYYYQVSAVNANGQSVRSSEVSATPGSDWFSSNLPDPGLQSLARTDFNRDGSITYADMQGLITQAITETGTGTASAAVVASLKELASSSGAAYLQMSASVEGLAYSLANGGQISYLGTMLGPLTANTTTAAQFQELDNKWFLGEDLPTIDTEYWSTSGYALANGTLFGTSSTPKYTDVAQGEEGDCWLCSSFAEIALKQPGIIQSSFTDDGLVSENGVQVHVWTYSYFEGSTREYMTVNNYFPSNSGVFMYTDAFQNMAGTSNVLWVPLMEKAYAGIFGGSYASLNGGWAQNVLPMETGGTGGGNVFTTESTYIAAIQSPKTLLTLGSWSANYGFIASHDYAVISVIGTGSTALFQLYNPWGTDQPPAITWAQLTQSGDFSQDGNTIVTAVAGVERLSSSLTSGGAALSRPDAFFANTGGASNFASDFHAPRGDDYLAANVGANGTDPAADPSDLSSNPAGLNSGGHLSGAKPDAELVSHFWASSEADRNSRFWDSV